MALEFEGGLFIPDQFQKGPEPLPGVVPHVVNGIIQQTPSIGVIAVFEDQTDCGSSARLEQRQRRSCRPPGARQGVRSMEPAGAAIIAP